MEYEHFIKDAPEIFKMFGKLYEFRSKEYGAPMAEVSCLICRAIIRLDAIHRFDANETFLCNFDLFEKHIYGDLSYIINRLSDSNKVWCLMTELGGNREGFITQVKYPFVVADKIFVSSSDYSLSSLFCDEFEFISPGDLNHFLKTVEFSSAFNLVNLIERCFGAQKFYDFFGLEERLKQYFIKDKTPIKCSLCGNQYLSLPDETILFAHIRKCVDLQFLRDMIRGNNK